MKKLLSSLATFTFLASSTATSVVACGGSHHSTARNEANAIDGQAVYLNDTPSKYGTATTTYEKQTAQQDASAIDAAIVTAKYLSATQVKDLSFDNTTKLTTGKNKAVAFNVKAPDGSTAQGTFNIVIDPGQKPFTPTTESPKDIANKLQGKTVQLDPTF